MIARMLQTILEPPGPGEWQSIDAPRPNGYDQLAVVALIGSIAVLVFYLPLSCIPCLGTLIIIPLTFVPLGLGIATLLQAHKAAEPGRARTYGWIATALGILLIALIVALIVAAVLFDYQMNQLPIELQDGPLPTTEPSAE